MNVIHKMDCMPLALVFFCLFVFFQANHSAKCMSSGAYEWPVLVALKHAVGLSQHWFLLQEWFRESHSKEFSRVLSCQ